MNKKRKIIYGIVISTVLLYLATGGIVLSYSGTYYKFFIVDDDIPEIVPVPSVITKFSEFNLIPLFSLYWSCSEPSINLLGSYYSQYPFKGIPYKKINRVKMETAIYFSTKTMRKYELLRKRSTDSHSTVLDMSVNIPVAIDEGDKLHLSGYIFTSDGQEFKFSCNYIAKKDSASFYISLFILTIPMA